MSLPLRCAPRALRRRRMQLPRQRAALLAHTHTTNRPYNLPEIGTKPADKSNRGGVAEWFSDPAVQKPIEVALTRITADDRLLTAVDCSIVTTAQQHDATPFDRRRSVPGIGTTLNLLLLYEMHASRRFPRAQEVVSSCRLVTWVKESAGQRSETSGATSGHASLTWACSEAAVLVLRDHPAGQTYLTRLETHHGQGKASTILAPTLARAVSDLFKRATTFALCRLVAT